ncbi:MAG TPA: type II toxin-antitoxin system VapC family toxin, partial [bacterium]|nr:type II toxin-antitoxin system VapC family toxin [bacterium]
MGGKFILDTNIVIALFAGDKAVKDKVTQAEEIYVPIIVLGELHYGAKKSSQVAANVARIEEFASSTSVLMCDRTTARFYGEVKEGLRRKGTPIPENDIWIAAIARQHEMSLVARD